MTDSQVQVEVPTDHPPVEGMHPWNLGILRAPSTARYVIAS